MGETLMGETLMGLAIAGAMAATVDRAGICADGR
jgi:hypothetical protein